MTSRRCAHCGQEIHAAAGSVRPKSTDSSTDFALDGPGVDAYGATQDVVFYSVDQPDSELSEWHDLTTHDHDRLSPASADTARQGRAVTSRSALVVGGCALALAAVALVAALLNSRGTIEPSTETDETAATAAETAGSEVGSDGLGGAGLAGAGLRDGGSSVGGEVEVAAGPSVDIGRWFREVVDSGDRTYSIVYPSSDGLRILNANGASSAAPQNAVGFEDARGLRLFSDGQQTWGVNPVDPFDNWIISRNYAVVDMGIEGAVAFVNSDDAQISVGASSFGGWGGGMVLPPGTETLSVQGLGLLVLPETGGTLIFKGGRLDPFTEGRVVAGAGDRVVVQRCDDSLVCTLNLLGESEGDGSRGEEVEVAAPIGADLTLSPDGQSVLVTDEGRNPRLIDITSGEVWQVDAGPIDAARWATDGSLVAWLSAGDLHVAIPSERRHETISLPSIPVTPTLIVIGP